MRFVFSRAFKYLIPRWRQLSVSIISLISVLVISLVVWLVLVFLSVTEGIEKRWIQQLVALHAPVRVVPTEAYYHSYYYQIDALAAGSHYTSKSVGEKLQASSTDPYDPNLDAELPPGFPIPYVGPDGKVVDLVKGAWSAIGSVKTSDEIRAQEYETSFAQLRLSLVRQEELQEEQSQTFLTQVSYLTSLDPQNTQFRSLVLPPDLADLNNLLFSLNLPDEEGTPASSISADLSSPQTLQAFFKNVEISKVNSSENGCRFPRALFPEEGAFKSCGIIQNGRLTKVIVPQNVKDLDTLVAQWSTSGHSVIKGEIQFGQGRPSFVPLDAAEIEIPKRVDIFLAPHISFKAQLLSESVQQALSANQIQFHVETDLQGAPLSGNVRMDQFELEEAHIASQQDPLAPFWVHVGNEGETVLPVKTVLGEGILIGKSFRENGVRLGDRGFLTYYTQTPSGTQEQRLPVYVAGFYDPGFLPLGSKMVYVDPEVLVEFRGNTSVADSWMGNGFSLWFSNLKDTKAVKSQLKAALKEKGLSDFWTVESYEDYEFARPVLQQLQSDKTLFSLIALIILLVACSNVISMLILLVNDKKKEIGILQALGSSATRIGAIFGVCGFFTGLVSSVIGFAAALFTLRHLQSLVDFLSFIQGREAFHAAFFGNSLPNQLSLTALLFVLLTTSLLAVLAGIAPAIKAARIRPSEILRSE